MKKTILITGSTDGIGLATAKILAEQGHHLLVHGRNEDKLTALVKELKQLNKEAEVQSYQADLSNLAEVQSLINTLMVEQSALDVLINNAGVFKVSQPITEQGFDVRFVVNTIAPYMLMQGIKGLFSEQSRVVNLSSAAQAPVDIEAVKGNVTLADMPAYAQSKLAITMWGRHVAKQFEHTGPIILSVNPGSLLASKMVKQGFGVAGHDISIGANILVKMSLDADMADYSGQYFDNDSGQFALPDADALDDKKAQALLLAMDDIIATNK